MKTFQVRLSDELYEAIKEISHSRDASLVDFVRESLEAHVINSHYAREGRRLFWEDPHTRDRAEVLIPGFAFRRLRDRALAPERT
jgi:hypothetical protein